MTDSLDVEGDREAFLWGGEVDERGAECALERGVGVLEWSGETRDAVEELLVLMKGDEGRALAPEEIDVAGDAGGCVFVDEVEFEAE